MGCAASHSNIVSRKQTVQYASPFKPKSSNQKPVGQLSYVGSNEASEGIRRVDTSKINANLDGGTGKEHYASPPDITNVTKDVSPKEEFNKTNKLGEHEQIYSKDPVLNKLLREMQLLQRCSISSQNMNKMKKLQSKINRCQVNKPTGRNSNDINQSTNKERLLKSPSNDDTSRGLNLNYLVNEVLSGNVASVCPSNDKIVRIFTSSTFTDTEHERNYLMENVYSKLKVFCQQKGYQFQIVDMRWGIRDEATNDHMTTDLCLKELELCQKLSTGPNFVSFLSHKYGYRPCPRTISKEQFEKFLNATENLDDKNFMLKWYYEDKNTLKSLYILQPVGDVLPDFYSPNPEKKAKAKDQWWEESGRLRNIICSLAKRLLSKEEARLFLMSVTEIEITKGVLDIDAVEDHCLWFKRNIKNIEHQNYDDYVKKYRECPNISDDFRESQELLENLKKEKMNQKIPTDNILSYDIPWTPEGVDPKANEEHRNYLTELGHDFQHRLQHLIENSIAKKNKMALNDPLYEEVKQHTLFCQKKCESFSGRNDTLMRIKDYVHGQKNEPLVIYGKSGSGKTSIMAKAAMSVFDWTNGKAAVVLRFIGTTLSSSDANSLMVSIIQQIQHIYSCPQPISANRKEIEKQFHESLKKGSEEKPLVLILDSLDQLNTIGGGRQLAWLMKDALSQHTKLILSTLPEKQHECFPKLKSWIKDDLQFWEVPRLPTEDVGAILSQWLREVGQTLTDKQRDIVLQAFNQCPLLLFLKLSFDVARSWHSYSPDSITVLEMTVRDSIKSLFNRIEVKHGKILVSHALGYLTLTENGLSELELEDILSCDEDVLNDVYMYWTPPIRRLPPLLLVRIKNDLEEYLVNRGSDGIQVIYWYHRQFIETATEIYCSNPVNNESLYSGLVDYFSSKWANGIPKPFVDKNGKSGECDRLVTRQPIKFDNAPNLRKLNNLPYLLVKARMLKRLKEEVLFNHEFILTKMKATSVREVLDDYLLACETFPQDEAIITITEALQLSQDALSYDPDQLPSQLIGRLPDVHELQPFIEACRNSELPYLEADHKVLVKPGGQLLHCIPAHKGEITSFDISSNKTTAVTLCMNEGCIKFWDPLRGQKISEFGAFEGKPEKVQFCDDDRLVALNPDNRIIFIFTETASFSHNLPIKSLVGHGLRENNPFFEVCGRKKTLIAFRHATNLIICDIKSSEKKYSISVSEEEADAIDPTIPAAGSDNFVVLSLMAETSKILAANLQTGHVNRLAVDPSSSASDNYASAITLCPKTDMLYFSRVENEELCCYNLLKMENVKIFQDDKHVVCENFRIAASGQFIHYIAEETVKVWDLNLQENMTVISQNGLRILDVGIVNETTIITTSKDANLRIWNCARKFQEPETKVSFEQISHGSVREVKFLPNPRYLLFMIGFEPFYWYVYDVTTREILMELQLINGNAMVFPLSNTQIAAISQSCKLKIVDLETCSITKVFQGKVHPSSCFLTIKNGKEILTTSCGRQNLKVYDTETGQTIKRIQCVCQNISHISINKSESIALAFTEGDCVLIVDMLQYKILHIINPNDIEFCDSILINKEAVQVSGDNTLLILMVNKYLDVNRKDSIYSTVLWNITQEKVHCHMFDKEYHERYKDFAIEISADVEAATFMQEDQVVLSTHDDYIIRIFSAASGELQKRIIQHINIPKLLFSPNENLPYFVSWVCSDEEIAFCLWQKETFEKIATFKLDEKHKKIALSPSGDVVIGRGNTDDYPITLWTLKNGITDPEAFSHMKEIDTFKKRGYGNTIKMTEDHDDEKDDSDSDDDLTAGFGLDSPQDV